MMEIIPLIRRIDALRAEIDAMRPFDADVRGRIMQKLRLDWNYHSSKIEGNSLTYGETKTFLLHGLTAEGKPLKDHLEIRGHNEAVLGLEALIDGREPLTEHTIRSLHQTILGEPHQIRAQTAEGFPTQRWVTPGRYKSEPNHVRTATGEIFYFASPESTAAEMEALMRWYNEASSDPDLHPLVVAATFHYKFIRIHPFDDGNGRIARILMNLVLMKGGYPPAIIKTEDKENYYRALRQADGGDVEPFIGYIGEQLLRSLEIFMRGARGESIEERDDVDKEIALFKAEIAANPDGELQLKRSPDALHRVAEQALRPLLDIVLKRLSQFDPLFLSHNYSLTAIGNFTQLQFLIDRNQEGGLTFEFFDEDTLVAKATSPDRIKDGLQAVIDHSETLSVLRLVYRWDSFKHAGADAFDHLQILEVIFRDYAYVVNPSRGDRTTITKFYHSTLSEDEMELIARELAKEVLEVLRERIQS